MIIMCDITIALQINGDMGMRSSPEHEYKIGSKRGDWHDDHIMSFVDACLRSPM